MLGRLLERLQHRVERGLRQHVHFVDQVDLVASDCRRVPRVVENLPHVVDAGVGRGVELEEVDEATGIDLGAGRADTARRGGNARHAIEALGKDPRDRGLAHTAGAGQQIRVVNAAARQRIGERRHHVLLAGQLGERHRPPLARKDLVAHWDMLAVVDIAGAFRRIGVRRGATMAADASCTLEVHGRPRSWSNEASRR